MSQRNSDRTRLVARAQIGRIQEALKEFEHLCSGTLVERYKLCGKPTCRCAHSRGGRHGPYYEWGYMKGGRQVHRMVNTKQAQLLREAIANYRAVLKLLRAWETQTLRMIELDK